jgi:asparaginyl-tRNA synthetase
MIEPEMAFADLDDDMDLGEALVKSLVTHVMEHCTTDLELFARFVDTDLMTNLEVIAGASYARLPYAEAVEILQQSGRAFEFPVHFGADLQTEHERYLTEEHFHRPVIVYNYPKEIKAFYMRLNDDNRTVAAMDLLVPRVGELIGGSQREERLEVLEQRLDAFGLPREAYWWYLDMRRFGTVPHAGFGLGFERFLMMVTGVTNIRDVIPFPRTPKHLEF